MNNSDKIEVGDKVKVYPSEWSVLHSFEGKVLHISPSGRYLVCDSYYHKDCLTLVSKAETPNSEDKEAREKDNPSHTLSLYSKNGYNYQYCNECKKVWVSGKAGEYEIEDKQLREGGVDYKAKYEKCISVIKRFDPGIIGMYDL